MEFETFVQDESSLAWNSSAVAGACDNRRREWNNLLQQAFGLPFTFLDAASGTVVETSEEARLWNWDAFGSLCRGIARRQQPTFIAEEDPVLVLAIPLPNGADNLVAVAAFVTRQIKEEGELTAAAQTLGMDRRSLFSWAVRQDPSTASTLQRIGRLLMTAVSASGREKFLREEIDHLAKSLAATYEEIGLLCRLTQNLKLSQSDEDLGRSVLQWLQEVLPAESLAIQVLPAPSVDRSSASRRRSIFLTSGNCPLNSSDFSRLAAHWDPAKTHRPIVINLTSANGTLRRASVRQMVLIPLAEGEHFFGWLAAINHIHDGEFGSVEVNLLNAVATILSIHRGNIELCRQQSELLEGVVRAFTSAIDAKDPSTCGHSDRVAQITVRLAEEMGCDAKTRKTLYLAGLLHDVGKIGIDDSVLRKQGRLSSEEYEHVKEHVAIGHHILQDLSKLESVLPVVLHHHEAWDGSGYPERLSFEAIPLAARIVSVADAFDAMSSDRPYRMALPDERVDSILRAGAGQQWDPAVIEAYFRCRDDIRRQRRSSKPLDRSAYSISINGSTSPD